MKNCAWILISAKLLLKFKNKKSIREKKTTTFEVRLVVLSPTTKQAIFRTFWLSFNIRRVPVSLFDDTVLPWNIWSHQKRNLTSWELYVTSADFISFYAQMNNFQWGRQSLQELATRFWSSAFLLAFLQGVVPPCLHFSGGLPKHKGISLLPHFNKENCYICHCANMAHEISLPM